MGPGLACAGHIVLEGIPNVHHLLERTARPLRGDVKDPSIGLRDAHILGKNYKAKAPPRPQRSG